eukprot:gnl/TRDRNA2_/TRDRNA2_115496_c0_seq1.p2 gnl/TRDRNA2_/TRDRNA2_115496_c0~~gnl/TRDRNA2_/TRDRNA2_115496_c0_seq1.p2  ORF type:complete len:108 (-),score=5.52 gnl/TRDRNA2_/TRDRNA2_115496_c0_seq1:265-588(-)
MCIQVTSTRMPAHPLYRSPMSPWTLLVLKIRLPAGSGQNPQASQLVAWGLNSRSQCGGQPQITGTSRMICLLPLSLERCELSPSASRGSFYLEASGLVFGNRRPSRP